MAWSHCFCVAEWYPIVCVCVCVCVCVHTPYLCPFTCWWALGLCPHLGYCKQCCCEHWSVCIFLNFGFLQMYAEEWDFTSIKWQKVEQVLFIPQIYICQKCHIFFSVILNVTLMSSHQTGKKISPVILRVSSPPHLLSTICTLDH